MEQTHGQTDKQTPNQRFVDFHYGSSQCNNKQTALLIKAASASNLIECI